MLRPLQRGTGLSFQFEPEYVAPTWPAERGHQQMTMHLDIAVDDVDEAVARALEAGAKLADHQPQAHVRVVLDPDGNPFCLFPDPGET
jgi:catechol 2,3-dioxygenase-like lactoylglutathione lyase family enzyme